MSGNALALARAGRNPDGNRRCPWDLGPACASLGYFSHDANSEVELRAKATRHSIATTPKHPSVESRFAPFPIVTYKVARRRKSFQFSLAVCLVTGSLDNNSLSGGAAWRLLAKSAEPTTSVFGRTQSGKVVSPHLEKRFPRIVYPIHFLSSADL